MRLINLEQLLEIHALVLQETGGARGLRDLGRLEAALATQTQNVFGEELYDGTIEKAAALIRGIIADHPFVDGNKRTAFLVGLTFLKLNYIGFNFKEGEIEEFAVKVVVKKLDLKDIVSWLNLHI
ncbi:MAG TPA: type II toxin-antitoxin system death-on-curing family toxin [Candidatus Saccharimonadales bacterium]|nr:type II toxin-antitoxin system death-on-curing family toxin [Candidatus Saccharimonadales bacterium]